MIPSNSVNIFCIHPESNNVPYHSLIKPETASSDFTFYPNPASETVVIRFKSSNPSTALLELYGMSGNHVCSIPISLTDNETSVSIKDIKPGIYFCRILTPGFQTKVQKLVVIK